MSARERADDRWSLRVYGVLSMNRLIQFLLLGVAVAAMSGCVFLDVKRQQEKLDAFCTFSGTVASERAVDKPLVVVLVRKVGEDPNIDENWNVFDHFVRERSGRWVFAAKSGVYGVTAFEDTNSNLVYEPDEPFLDFTLDDLLVCEPGGKISGIALMIPESGRLEVDGPIDVAELQARTVHDQMRTSIGLVTAVGEVVDLADPRFSEENARNGLWRPFDFLFDARPGIYLLEEYDPDKTPILFVHGVQGTPRNFQYIISNLDRDTFQPWVYYYPSGAPFADLVGHLDQTMKQLRRRLGFDELFVVAHSAGGLVSRAFIFKHRESLGRGNIPIFVTIATPWDGHKAAAKGVRNAPVVVHSWRDLAPGSQFLTEMFFTGNGGTATPRHLPLDLTHHLIFAFKRNPRSFGESDDETVTVDSQMRWEAQEDAGHRVYGFNETHTGILKSGEVSRLINEILVNGRI